MHSIPRDVTLSDLFVLCILCGASGRGFPDIAAQALGFRIFINGNEYGIFGTSGSAPVRLSRLLSGPTTLVHPVIMVAIK
jgi:hypothetical protein